MNITPNEIHSIEEAGMLDNAPVKMIRTKGGFWIGIGKPKGKAREEALAAGSHPAIVKYNIEKAYPQFQPTLMKSEDSVNPTVDQHSHFLSDELRKSGHDIYSVQTNEKIEFHVQKHGERIGTATGSLRGDTIVFEELKMPKEFARALAGATIEKAMACGAKKTRIES
jgi:hypothetical protein